MCLFKQEISAGEIRVVLQTVGYMERGNSCNNGTKVIAGTRIIRDKPEGRRRTAQGFYQPTKPGLNIVFIRTNV
jgi:hypothetical protein